MVSAIIAKIISSTLFFINNYIVKNIKLHPLDIAFGEYFYSSILALIFCRGKHKVVQIISGLISSIGVIYTYKAYQDYPLHLSGIYSIIGSLIVAITSFIFFKEKLSMLKLIAYMIGIIPILIEYKYSLHTTLLVSNLFLAFSVLFYKYLADNNYSIKYSILYMFFFISLYKLFSSNLKLESIGVILINKDVILVGILLFISLILLQYAYTYHDLISLTIFGKIKILLMILSDGNLNLETILSTVSLVLISIDMHAYYKGIEAEKEAIRYLVEKGCKIVAHRKKTLAGEIDIVMLHNETLVAVEVKYRKNYNEGMYAIDKRKYLRISNSLSCISEEYINISKEYMYQDLRIDALIVTKEKIFWIQNVIV